MEIEEPKGPFCQSCGMSLNKPEDFGTNLDGSRNEEYCGFCYQKGAFTEPNITKEEMMGKVAGILRQMKMPEDQVNKLTAFIPALKRWNQ